jgi:small subunit ribosomal protein S20
MPVTTTAKRALRSSKNKQSINKITLGNLEAAIRMAKKSKSSANILKAVSLTDRAAKKKVIHSNKAARIKSQLSKLLPKKIVKSEAKSSKKTPKK